MPVNLQIRNQSSHNKITIHLLSKIYHKYLKFKIKDLDKHIKIFPL